MTDVTDILRKFPRVPRTHAQGSCLFTRVYAVRAESFYIHLSHLSSVTNKGVKGVKGVKGAVWHQQTCGLDLVSAILTGAKPQVYDA